MSTSTLPTTAVTLGTAVTTKAIPPGCFAVSYCRSYSEPFQPRNGPFTPDMLGRQYINVPGLGHFRTTRVVADVTSKTENGVRTITSVDWSTNPHDAKPLAAGDVSKSLQALGFIDSDPRTATYNNYDVDGNIESTSLVWEKCENPDPLPTATVSTSSILFGK